MSDSMSRRAFLQIGTASASAVLLLACGAPKTEPDSCTDETGLSDADKSARATLKYTDRSPEPDKRCSGCSLFQPSADPVKCGACQVVKGPIHPHGTCLSFAKKA